AQPADGPAVVPVPRQGATQVRRIRRLLVDEHQPGLADPGRRAGMVGALPPASVPQALDEGIDAPDQRPLADIAEVAVEAIVEIAPDRLPRTLAGSMQGQLRFRLAVIAQPH